MNQITILIVDDDTAIRETLRLVLEEADEIACTVTEAYDGLMALDMLRASQDHSIVLVDHIMPLMNGAEFLRTVASDPQLAQQHVYIFLSGQSRPNAELNLPPNLPVFTMAKPFDVDRLIELVQSAAQMLEQRDSATVGVLPDTLSSSGGK